MNAGLRGWGVWVWLGAVLSMACSASFEEPQDSYAASSPGAEEPKQRGARRKQSDQFSNILLTTQHGEQVRFYDDLVKDKVVMINLMYTTCTKICPGTAANLVQVHAALGERMGRDISILSLSIDPEVDTPERLKRYWEAFGSKPGWLYLTGDFDEIDRLRHELGVYDLDPIIDADKTQHSGVLTFGNDRTNRWAALPALMHAEQMAATIVRITSDGKWQRRRRTGRDAEEPEPSLGQGFLRGVDAEKGEVVIEHGEIPGLMMAMTMSFEVADRKLLEGLSPGQAVDFRVEHSQGRYRILEIGPRGRQGFPPDSDSAPDPRPRTSTGIAGRKLYTR